MANVRSNRPHSHQIKARRISQPSQTQRADIRQAFGPYGQPSGKSDQPINDTRFDQRGGKRAAPFAKDTGDPVGGKLFEHITGVKLTANCRTGQQGRPKAAPCVLQSRIGIPPMAHQHRHIPRRARKCPHQRHIKAARDNDARGLRRDTQTTHRQRRIVLPRGATADHHRIVARAHSMDCPARLRPGDPLAFARPCGNPPIKAVGQFQGHKRALFRSLKKKARIVSSGHFGTKPRFNRDTGIAQHRKASTAHPRVCILDRNHNARHTGRNQRLRTGRGLTVMRTRLQSNIGDRATRSLPGLGQGHRFSMRTPTLLGPAAPDNAACIDDDASHSRVRCGIAQAAPPQGQRELHEPRVVACAHSSGCVSGRNSATNLSKSSAAWKFL
mmetsp:Transcript_22601/g.36914  ORF Transcript_22601/g.36914 Transcript_22601/m.36914 type:complete len:385 (-) Transcript_22601:2167-3321(-)